jgi:hypothetical protein
MVRTYLSWNLNIKVETCYTSFIGPILSFSHFLKFPLDVWSFVCDTYELHRSNGNFEM